MKIKLLKQTLEFCGRRQARRQTSALLPIWVYWPFPMSTSELTRPQSSPGRGSKALIPASSSHAPTGRPVTTARALNNLVSLPLCRWCNWDQLEVEPGVARALQSTVMTMSTHISEHLLTRCNSSRTFHYDNKPI